jgi:hypothetical protein
MVMMLMLSLLTSYGLLMRWVSVQRPIVHTMLASQVEVQNVGTGSHNSETAMGLLLAEQAYVWNLLQPPVPTTTTSTTNSWANVGKGSTTTTTTTTPAPHHAIDSHLPGKTQKMTAKAKEMLGKCKGQGCLSAYGALCLCLCVCV